MVPDKDRKERLAFAIRAAMGKRTAQDIADAIQPKRSKETIARWARGETVPSALDIAPLAAALGVRMELLVAPPELPTYPIEDYLIPEADAQRAVDLARGAVELAREDLEQEASGRRAAAGSDAARRGKRPA